MLPTQKANTYPHFAPTAQLLDCLDAANGKNNNGINSVLGQVTAKQHAYRKEEIQRQREANSRLRQAQLAQQQRSFGRLPQQSQTKRNTSLIKEKIARQERARAIRQPPPPSPPQVDEGEDFEDEEAHLEGELLNFDDEDPQQFEPEDSISPESPSNQLPPLDQPNQYSPSYCDQVESDKENSNMGGADAAKKRAASKANSSSTSTGANSETPAKKGLYLFPSVTSPHNAPQSTRREPRGPKKDQKTANLHLLLPVFLT